MILPVLSIPIYIILTQPYIIYIYIYIYIYSSSTLELYIQNSTINDIYITTSTTSFRGSNVTVNNCYFGTSGTSTSPLNIVQDGITFNKLEVQSGYVNITKSLTVDSLFLLGEGVQYTHSITSGKTLAITDTFAIKSNGCFPNTLQGSGGVATINVVSGKEVNADFLRVQNITGLGGGTFNAGANGTDLGGNTNWTFTGPTWTTSIDQINFECRDALNTYTIHAADSFTQGFVWSDGSTDDSLVVVVDGTYWVDNNYGTNCTQRDTFIVTSTAPAGAISLGWIEALDTLWQRCQNWNGELTPDSLTTVQITKGVVYTSGILQINDGATTTSGSDSSYVDGYMRKDGSTDFVFPLGSKGRWGRLGITSLISSANYSAKFEIASLQDLTVDGSLTNVSLPETWQLTRNSGVSGTKPVLYWEDATYSGITSTLAADLVVAHWDNGLSNWESYGQDDVFESGSTGWLKGSYQTDFSPLKFGSPSGVNPLPIELMYFDAVKKEEHVLLIWETAAEINNDHFLVQRSMDGVNFETISKIISQAGNGNSNTILTYKIEDNTINKMLHSFEETIYYQLIQVDIDGQQTKQGIKTITFSKDSESFKITPNPFNNQANLIISNNKNNSPLELNISSVNGEVVETIYLGITEDGVVSFNTAHLLDFILEF